MLQRSTCTGLAMIALLAGCDGGGTSQPASTQRMSASNPYVEQLRKLSPTNQGLALRRAVQDSGMRCKRVATAGYQQDFKNMSVWNLRCTDGEYILFIAPNADVQVRSCSDAQKLDLPKCRFAESAEAEAPKSKG